MGTVVKTKPDKSKKDLLTYADYLTFPDNDGIRKEIIEGELFMTPAPSLMHQTISKNLFRILDDYVSHNKLGSVFFAPCDIIFSGINVVQPDIFFISNENKNIISEHNVRGAPDLIAEILSPSTAETDRNFKKIIYEKFAVKEYWIVDPENEIVEVWILKGKKFTLFQKRKKNQTVKSKLLKDLLIELSSIFTPLVD